MMLKFLLLIVLLFFALGIAAAVLRRLSALSERIAGLQGEMKKNELKMELQLQKLQEQQAVDNEEKIS